MTTSNIQLTRNIARRGPGLRLWLLWLGVALMGFAGLGRLTAADTLIISEFVASNVGGLVDEDLDSSDWIELYNYGNSPANLLGWYLTDNTNNLTKWAFPSTTISARGFLIVFASGKDRTLPGAPLHANFQLGTDGGQLALVHGNTIVSQFAPAYPGQRANYSYGLVQNVVINKLINSNAAARVLVPSDGSLGATWTAAGFNDASWLAATNGVGYETSVPGFRVINYKANIVVDTLAKSETVTVTPSQQTKVISTNTAVVNFSDQQGDGHYGSNLPWPGEPPASTTDDFVVEATGTITIPAAGLWTFGVNSDDGFRLQIVTNLAVNGTNKLEYDPPRGPGDTLGTFNFAAPGEYPLRLLYYERGGGAECELWAAQGNFTVWGNNFTLVGDQANGGLSVRSLPVSGSTGLGYRNQIRTDVQSQMLSNNATAYVRLPFPVATPGTLSSLYLEVKYDDGFVAYLNGTEVARRNAPAVPGFSSAATTAHFGGAFEEINLSGQLGLLQSGANVLAIQALNESPVNSDFFVLAELWEIQANATGTNLFFSTPTPGTFNTTPSFNGFVGDTHFSVDRGFYDTNFFLAITSATPGVTIRYTLDGSEPTLANGLTYSTPLLVSNTTVMRAAGFLTGLVPSDVDCQTYIFVEDVIRQSPTGVAPPGWPTSWGANTVDYGMDPDIVNSPLWSNEIRPALKSLPTFCIVMNLSNLFNPTTGIYANPSGDEIAWERPGSLELLYPDGTKGFQINCGVRLRGGFSRDPANPKHAFRFFFRQEYGASKLKFPIFGSDGAQEFNKIDLRTMQNYSWAYQNDTRMICLRDQLARDAQLAMGDASSHGIFCHLYINGQYWGLYNTDERPEANFGESYFGGRAEDYDTVKVDPDSSYNIEPTDGTLDAYMRLWMACTNNTINDVLFYKLQGLNPDGTINPAYENLLDVTDLINYMLIAYFGGNLDAPISNFLSNTSPNNYFGFRNRLGISGGFKYVMHDSEHTLLDPAQDRTGPWTAGNPGTGFPKANPQYFFQQLMSNLEFKMAVADRMQKHFYNGGVLTPESNRAQFLVRSNEIYKAIVAESARWGDAKRAVPFNRNDWVAAMNTVYGYFGARTATVVQQFRAKGWFPFLAAPNFNQYGGLVSTGFNLTMSQTNVGGVIYYTLDGTDPRLVGGATSGAALVYSAPILILENTSVRARVKVGANWSAAIDALFTTSQYFRNIAITEIMYNPPGTTNVSGDEFEFLELKNVGTNNLNLSGLSFSAGITFSFTNGTRLAPGAFFVLARNKPQFQLRYPGVAVNGIYSGHLDNGGETLTLAHAISGSIFAVTYDDSPEWPQAADGLGFSIVPVSTTTNLNSDQPRHWRASSAPGGSPGTDDAAPSIPAVVINEVLTHTPVADYIELLNPSASPASVGGWFLTDDPALPTKYRITDGTMIPGGDVLLIPESSFNPTPGLGSSFALNGEGGKVFLFSGDATTNLTGYSHGFSFGASAEGVTFGRYVISTGEEQFPSQIAPTPGAANSGPLIADVVINEIHYNPRPGGDAFVEIKNRSGAPVALYDSMRPTNTWRLNGIDFIFPTNVTLPAGGLALVVETVPAEFRAKYSVPAAVPIFGPYGGTLQDSGELLELQRLDFRGTNNYAWVTLDAVRYNDRAPWPEAADGAGASLQRLNPGAYGNDPINWTAATPHIGTDFTPGGPPVISQQPANTQVLQGNTTLFSVNVSGTPPFDYQWQYNGNSITGANNSMLLLTNVAYSQAGAYRVIVLGGAGNVESSNASLTVLVPANITLQPVNVDVRVRPDPSTTDVAPSTNASFTVAATTLNSPLSFQWRMNGTNLAASAKYSGVTGTTLIVSNVTIEDYGEYTCAVTDLAGTISSGTAILYPLVRPTILIHPATQSVPAFSAVPASVVLSNGFPPPFRYIWYRGSSAYATNISESKTNFMVIPGTIVSNLSASYTVRLTNRALTSPSAGNSANFTLTVLADSDLDGLPDSYEMIYSGTTNLFAPGLDMDGDGMSNLAEYLAGTDPGDPNSYLRIDQTITPGVAAVNFAAISNRTYTVQFTDVLPAAGWQKLADVVSRPSNRVEVMMDPAWRTNRYYRAVTPRQP